MHEAGPRARISPVWPCVEMRENCLPLHPGGLSTWPGWGILGAGLSGGWSFQRPCRIVRKNCNGRRSRATRRQRFK